MTITPPEFEPKGYNAILRVAKSELRKSNFENYFRTTLNDRKASFYPDLVTFVKDQIQIVGPKDKEDEDIDTMLEKAGIRPLVLIVWDYGNDNYQNLDFPNEFEYWHDILDKIEKFRGHERNFTLEQILTQAFTESSTAMLGEFYSQISDEITDEIMDGNQ